MLYQFQRVRMHRCRWLVSSGVALAAFLAASAAQGQPQWRAHRLPSQLADAPLEQRVDYLHRHLIEPANESARQQLQSAAHAMPSRAELGSVTHQSVAPIARDRLVVETFITPAMTDDVVAALCALKGVDNKVKVVVEHRNYVVLQPDTVTPNVSTSTQCLKDWHASTDYGGKVTQARGVPRLPYFAAHYGGSTVQGDLADYRYKIQRLAMQYGL